jgi:hypothetical protein
MSNAPSAAALHAELGQLREALESAHQRNRHLESALRKLLGEAAGQPATVTIFDAFPASARAHAAVPARQSERRESIWPRSRATPRALQPTPGAANLTLGKRGLPVVGISVCGLPEANLRRILEVIAAKLSADRNFVPLFLTDAMAPELFREHRFAFEYFPMDDESVRLGGSCRWSDYAGERAALLRRKYAIQTIIRFGKRGFCGLE